MILYPEACPVGGEAEKVALMEGEGASPEVVVVIGGELSPQGLLAWRLTFRPVGDRTGLLGRTAPRFVGGAFGWETAKARGAAP